MKVADASVLVIGAGVVGLMSAFALLKRGVSVSVLDAGAPGAGSSWAGGGIVCPVPPWNYGPVVEQTVRTSREQFDAWLPEIEALSGIDCEYHQSGLLLSGNPNQHDFVAMSATWRAQTSERTVVGQRQDFDAGLPHGDWPAVLLPDVPQIRNPRLIQALVASHRALGGDLCAHCPVERLVQQADGRISAWQKTTCLGVGERVVLAAGAWSDQILQASGLSPLGVSPMRGQMLLFHLPPDQAPKHITNTGEGYLIPRLDGHILAGSTIEDVGFDTAPTPSAADKIHQMAVSTWPRLQSAPIIQHWAGLRPGHGSDEPAVGHRHADWPGLWVNTGHFRNGLGMAPACAEQTAEALS